MRTLVVALTFLIFSVPNAIATAPAPSSGKALLLELQGAIGPASHDFITRGLKEAQARNAAVVILRIDTPGGLDSSMREIIKAILASPVPIIGYVAPEGARAASAGTYILYACHLAAMAPATNLGAATPVQIGGLPTMPNQPPEDKPAIKPADTQSTEPATDTTPASESPTAEPEPAKKDKHKHDHPTPLVAGSKMERKIMNDARAYIRALAQMRGRNVVWAEQAITEAASLSAEEALQKNVIDLIAVDVNAVLQQAQGRSIEIAGQKQTLITQDLHVETLSPDWRNRLLALIAHPMIAYVLLLLGFYGLFFELTSPGTAIPGVLGGICLLLALFAFQIMSINYTGLALLLLGLAFMAAEAFIPSFGILGIGGIIAFITGSLLLWDETAGYNVPLSFIAGFALASAAILIGLLTMTLRHHRKPAVTGDAQLIGLTGKMMADGRRVWVHGESWLVDAEQPLSPEQPVQVIGRNGLTLFVTPLDNHKGEPLP